MKAIFRTVLFSLILWQGSALAHAVIEAPGGLQAAPAGTQHLSYNFGMVRVGFSEYVDLRIRNVGQDSLYFKSMDIDGIDFGARSDCPDALAPGEFCYVTIRFSPAFEYTYWGDLFVDFTNGDAIRVNLYGRGSRF